MNTTNIGNIKAKYYKYSLDRYHRMIKTPEDVLWLRKEVARIRNKYFGELEIVAKA